MADAVRAPQTGQAVVTTQDDLVRLLSDRLHPDGNEQAKSEVRGAVDAIVQRALAGMPLVGLDAVSKIEAMIAELDQRLSRQVDQILHHEAFRRLEGTWRGLSYMVNNTPTDDKLKIRVLNVSKKELSKTFAKYPGAKWEQSPIFKKLYSEEYGMPNGEPYGCIVGDFEFDHSAPDVEILSGMAKIAAAAHAPFLSSAAPNIMGMQSWQELGDPNDLSARFRGPQYAPWRSLRDSDDARYLGLTVLRFLSRLPYGQKTNPVDDFIYEEETGAGDHGKYVWSNSAYAMGTNVMRSFKNFGMCTSIRGLDSGGQVLGLPCHTFQTDDGEVDMKCPTELAITKRREKELADLGFMPLAHWKNTDYAVFVGAQSLQKPKEFDDPDATANASLSARLPYMFAVCRFAHFLNHMVYNWVGAFTSRDELRDRLQNWIANYVTTDPTASQEMKARFPLAAAEVVVAEDAANPGYYRAQFYLRPHFQLEGMTGSLRLVSKLPSQKKDG